MAITTLNNRSINRADTGAADQLWTLTSATATDFQAAAAGGKLGAVVQTVKTDTTSTTSTSLADISGMAVTTGTLTSGSKVLVYFTVSLGMSVNKALHLRLLRGATAIAIGDASGSTTRATLHVAGDSHDYTNHTHTFMYLDSPGTTSATTYKLQWHVQSAGESFLNKALTTDDNSSAARCVSTMTTMEILS